MLKYLIFGICASIICSASISEETQIQPVRCDYQYSEEAKGWLRYDRVPDTWFNARTKCIIEGSMLASPTSQLSSPMMSIMENQTATKIFVGINNWHAFGPFLTIDGLRTDISIPHMWEEGKPMENSDSSRCVSLSSFGKLDNLGCNRKLPFICYKKEIIGEEIVCGTFSKGYVRTVSNSCHKVHKKATTFFKAYKTCNYEGGYLTIINSQEEANIVTNMLRLYTEDSKTTIKGSAFIGIHKLYDVDGDFYTVKDHTLTEAGYSKFARGESFDAGTDKACGSIKRDTGELTVLSCYSTQTFVCEIDV